MRNTSRGFTLIELLVVISIVAILSSIIIAALSTARQQATTAAGKLFQANITHTVDGSVVFLDFDSISSLTSAAVIANEKGSLPISSVSFSATPPVLVSDTTLHNGGMQISIPTSGSTPFNINVPGIGNIIQSDNFTFAAWYKPLAGSYVTNWNAPLIGWDINAGGASIGINYANTNGVINQIGVHVPSAQYQIPVNLPAGQWAYIAMSVQNLGSNNVAATLYVNGQFVYKFTTPVTAYTPSYKDYIGIGGFCCSALTTGLIDDVSIYSNPLSTAEIERTYAIEAPRHNLAVDTH